MDALETIGNLVHSSTVPDSATGSAAGSFNLFDVLFGKPQVSTDVSISSSTKTFIYVVLGVVAALVLFGKKKR